MPGPVPRAGILDVAPYRGGDGALPGFDKVIKLASNEGALGPSPKVREHFRGLQNDLHIYADGDAATLRRAIAAHHGLDGERIVCSNGSDHIISMLCQAYSGPGDEVLHSEHGFMMYKIAATVSGATPVAARETDLRSDVDAILARVGDKTRLVFIANPNNPTGTYLTAAELDRLHGALPDNVLLVIDAAYGEYVTRSDYAAGHHLVDRADNVVVLRTFSKIYALAKLRLGWAHCPRAVVDVLNRVRTPFNVNGVAQQVAVTALTDTDHVRRSRRHTDRWRRWLTEECRSLGLSVPDSIGNFILVGFPGVDDRTGPRADDFLRGRGIIVRRQDPVGLTDHLRITIGTERDMYAVRDALAAFMAGGKA